MKCHLRVPRCIRLRAAPLCYKHQRLPWAVCRSVFVRVINRCREVSLQSHPAFL